MTRKFAEFANWIAVATGHPIVFGIAVITVAIWLITGPASAGVGRHLGARAAVLMVSALGANA